jgi:ribose/xylose/arabinose/galactoside ABC-type transport system permease subunit
MAARRLHSYLFDGVLEIILLAICVWLAIRVPEFRTVENLLSVLRSVSEIGVIAFGMTLVIIAGEIDLSVGSVVALAGCLVAWLVQSGCPAPAAIAAALAAGSACGCVTGLMRVRYGVPTFITSLAMMSVLRGAAHKLTGGFPIAPFPEWYNFLGSGYWVGVPFPAIVFVATFVMAWVLLNHTAFGRSIYAVGGNAEAARLCGIAVGAVRVLVLAVTGGLAAASGVMLSARMMSGTPTVATGWELDVIAAVIVGGTSLRGGAGSVWGTLVGVIFIGVIVNGMRLLDVHEDGQLIARGVIIVLAVLLTRLRRGPLEAAI